MTEVHKDVTVKSITKPSGVSGQVVCQDSGKIASGDCPNTRTDYFRSGKGPSAICVHSEYLENPEDKIDDTIENEDQGLNENEPGSTTENPTPEGNSPISDDESQYWWEGD